MKWIGFTRNGQPGFGRLTDETIEVFTGDLFAAPRPSGETIPLAAIVVDLPCRPTKLFALWNNFHAAADKQGLDRPSAPLFFVKPPNTYRASGASVTIPEAAGRVVFEGELGVVIGRSVRDASEDEAAAAIFGYTCINDVTSPGVLKADPSFPQWTRSKGFDGFCPIGPVIATEIDPLASAVVVMVNGRERQRYPLADMIMPPARLVAMISQGVTLEPGDIIACGTSNGAGPIPKGALVEVTIEGVGTLSNRFD